ncbi:shikimate kinase [Candidatus Kinetoplastibacterium blastocrithidii TCC012E]|uniref:Shikimate kinase n=1 Tax=Candidatus Kinetoplastidibacterium blastocrithidiae TCC012E TaxID=1208922 RepID=M1LCF5_9PROT|nr:shikimate kinase [Candidatus Kinetoplastibacterium blastocrithidii]AFZ83307.1 shikimate kinase [Candidatus Kinetoplastibacterium blastocrithidii (ex Strigomonas culicis)]AGF50123.1 shikimate kinase [Candidatus Kinetoplastibacterium blastocrithidii TCC012E]
MINLRKLSEMVDLESILPESKNQNIESENVVNESLPYDTPIFLIGMMGSGKTTIGRNLSSILDRKFIDLDLAIESRCGVSIPTIFEIEGESGFRKREEIVLLDCSNEINTVLATGGGAVLSHSNRDVLKKRGIVVYFQASLDDLFQRTNLDSNRPLLSNTDKPYAILRELLEQREPIYKEVADIIISTSNASISDLVNNLVSILQTYEKFK